MLKLLKTTVTGGLVFLIPIAVLAYILGRIVLAAEKIVAPIAGKFPESTVAGVSVTIIIAVVGLIVISFLAGLLAKTRLAQQAVRGLESHVLARFPAYGLLKSLGSDFVTPEQEAERRVVLVRFDDAWQLGIKIKSAVEDTHTVVFLPDSPTAQSGTVMIVETSRVQVTDIPLHKAMSAMAVRGMGLLDLLKEQFRERPATP